MFLYCLLILQTAGRIFVRNVVFEVQRLCAPNLLLPIGYAKARIKKSNCDRCVHIRQSLLLFTCNCVTELISDVRRVKQFHSKCLQLTFSHPTKDHVLHCVCVSCSGTGLQSQNRLHLYLEEDNNKKHQSTEKIGHLLF